jgi:hypothetical protein
MTTPLRTGESVLIEYEGRTLPGSVMLASGNGRSLMLAFDGLLGGHAGMMPVLQDEHGAYSALMTGAEVKVTRLN